MERCSEKKRLTRDCLVQEAQNKVFDLDARGSTNINEALLEAIELAMDFELAANIASDEKLQKMIVFLTDGDPTEGVTDKEEIKKNVKKANIEYR